MGAIDLSKNYLFGDFGADEVNAATALMGLSNSTSNSSATVTVASSSSEVYSSAGNGAGVQTILTAAAYVSSSPPLRLRSPSPPKKLEEDENKINLEKQAKTKSLGMSVLRKKRGGLKAVTKCLGNLYSLVKTPAKRDPDPAVPNPNPTEEEENTPPIPAKPWRVSCSNSPAAARNLEASFSSATTEIVESGDHIVPDLGAGIGAAGVGFVAEGVTIGDGARAVSPPPELVGPPRRRRSQQSRAIAKPKRRMMSMSMSAWATMATTMTSHSQEQPNASQPMPMPIAIFIPQEYQALLPSLILPEPYSPTSPQSEPEELFERPIQMPEEERWPDKCYVELPIMLEHCCISCDLLSSKEYIKRKKETAPKGWAHNPDPKKSRKSLATREGCFPPPPPLDSASGKKRAASSSPRMVLSAKDEFRLKMGMKTVPASMLNNNNDRGNPVKVDDINNNDNSTNKNNNNTDSVLDANGNVKSTRRARSKKKSRSTNNKERSRPVIQETHFGGHQFSPEPELSRAYYNFMDKLNSLLAKYDVMKPDDRMKVLGALLPELIAISNHEWEVIATQLLDVCGAQFFSDLNFKRMLVNPSALSSSPGPAIDSPQSPEIEAGNFINVDEALEELGFGTNRPDDDPFKDFSAIVSD